MEYLPHKYRAFNGQKRPKSLLRLPPNMTYWLIKSEPDEYSFAHLLRDQSAVWDGVRNPQARRYLSEMQVGDRLFYYHSMPERAVVGLAQVTRAAFPDPTDPRWIAVEIRPLRRFVQPIPLARIKADPRFADFALVRQARLSVMPVPPPLADILLEWGQPISL
jgi:predicted RNA-binding protein with PUA-like domain